METTNVMERYLAALLEGNRLECRAIIGETLQKGMPANILYMDIIWPIMVEVEKLFKAGKITPAQEHLTTRINRSIVDQLQNKLPRKLTMDKKIVIICAQTDSSELGAQISADIFESHGWDVRLLGGGINNDDVLAFIHEYRPDILMVYGATSPMGPSIRELIDTIRTINAWPEIKFMVCGGLFNRAEGLWEEIGADLFAYTAAEAVEIASGEGQTQCKPERTINRRKIKLQKPMSLPELTTV